MTKPNNIRSMVAGIVSGGIGSTGLSSDEENFLKAEKPCGLTMFARNIDGDFRTFQQLNQKIRDIVPSPIISIDQEGGRVNRFSRAFLNHGPALGLKDIEPTNRHFIRNYAFMVGSSLKSLGVNVNFAPVCDILTNEENIAIGDRCFGKDVESVVAGTVEYLEGLQESGVLGCLKHFPGQGEADFDTHEHTAIVDVSIDQLRTRELLPFKNLSSTAPMVMISHVIYPAIDDELATCSKAMIDLLRNEVGFQGVVVSDDLIMKAFPQEEKAWVAGLAKALEAGIDLLLVCRGGLSRWQLAINGLSQAAENSESLRNAIVRAYERVSSMRERLV